MPEIQPLQPSFNAGEINPRLAARLDFAKYASALEECTNLVPLPEGGLIRRAATRFVAEVEDSDSITRILPFEASATQQHIVELNEFGMHFFFRQGQLFVATTDAAITNGDFVSGITDWDDVSTGLGSIAHDAVNQRLSLIPGGTAAADIGIAEQDVTTTDTNQEHVIKFQVIGAPGDRIQFQVGTTTGGAELFGPTDYRVGYHCVAFTPTASPFYVQFRNLGSNANKTVQIDNVSLISGAAVEIDAPYLEEDLFGIFRAQSADVQYLFHPMVPPYKLERRGLTSWSLVRVEWVDGPWLDANTTPTTMNPAATSGLGITVTASSTENVNDGQGFLSTDVGRLIRQRDAGFDWGYGIIVGVTDSLNVTVDIKRNFPAATAQTNWQLGAWSDTTGWPSTGGFFEQRLYVASTINQPQTLWASQTADFENHTPDDADQTSPAPTGAVEDDDALDFTLSADSINEIYWLSAGEDTLAIGTSGGEWVPSAQGIVITPNDITIRRQTTHGCARVTPLRVGQIVLFVQRASRRIREFGFNFETDGYLAPDMTRLAQHITESGIKEMAYAEEPDSLVWAVLNNGTLLNMTYRRDEDVVGWAKHKIGGNFDGGDAVVESVASIIGSDDPGQVQTSDDRNEVWVVVKRTIDGVTKRYIEFLERDFVESHDQEDAYYADSLITFDAGEETLTAVSNGQQTFTYTIESPADNGDLPVGGLADLGTVGVLHELSTWGDPVTSHTFADFAIPVQVENATLIVAVATENAGSVVISGVTFDGTPMVEINRASGLTSFQNEASLWRLDGASGTGDIVVSFSGGNTSRGGVAAMVAENIDLVIPFVQDENSSSISAPSSTVNLLPGYERAVAINVMSTAEGVAATPTGTGHTELVDVEIDSNMRMLLGYADVSTAGNLALTWTRDGGGNYSRIGHVGVLLTSVLTGDEADFDIRLNDVRLVNGEDYVVDLATKIITLSSTLAASVVVDDELLVKPQTQTITGLDHLEGEQVKIWGDGAILPEEPVCELGCITLDTPVNVAQIGLSYKHRMKTLKVEGGNAAGTALGKVKRIYGMTVTLLNSQKFNFGPDTNGVDLEPKDFRNVSDPMDEAVPLFTGEVFVEFDGDWDVDSRVVIEGEDPAPFTLLALAPEIQVNPQR